MSELSEDPRAKLMTERATELAKNENDAIHTAFKMGYAEGVRAERERCLKIAESGKDSPATADSSFDRGYLAGCDDIAANIRIGE